MLHSTIYGRLMLWIRVGMFLCVAQNCDTVVSSSSTKMHFYCLSGSVSDCESDYIQIFTSGLCRKLFQSTARAYCLLINVILWLLVLSTVSRIERKAVNRKNLVLILCRTNPSRRSSLRN